MNDRYYLEITYEEAQKAASKGQIPVGAVVVDEMGQILAKDHNRVNERNNRTAHAEMLTIFSALEQYDGRMAPTWSVYTTLEPCPMCLGTIIMTNIGRVVWAAPDDYIQTHQLMKAIPYLRKQKLKFGPSPYPDLKRKSGDLHRAYWVGRGQPEKTRPIIESSNQSDD